MPLPELEISPATIWVTEDSTTSTTYTVKLSSLPTAETTVTMSVDDSAVATISPDSLTFTTTNGTTAQEVTVTAVSDADPLNETTMILHLVSIGDYEFPTASLPVEVTDDEAPVLTLTSTTTGVTFPGDVSEGYVYDGLVKVNEGDSATYTAVLGSEPSADVTISLLSRDTDVVTVSPSSITFTKEGEAQDADKWEWNDAQTVTLTPVPDADASDEISTIRHESTIGGKNYVLAQARILVRDSTLPGADLRVIPTGTVDQIDVVEGGTATYTIVPNAEVPPAEPGNPSSWSACDPEATETVEPDLNHTFTVGDQCGNWETPADGDRDRGQSTMTSSTTLAYIRHRNNFTMATSLSAGYSRCRSPSQTATGPHTSQEGMDPQPARCPENAGQWNHMSVLPGRSPGPQHRRHPHSTRSMTLKATSKSQTATAPPAR